MPAFGAANFIFVHGVLPFVVVYFFYAINLRILFLSTSKMENSQGEWRIIEEADEIP